MQVTPVIMALQNQHSLQFRIKSSFAKSQINVVSVFVQCYQAQTAFTCAEISVTISVCVRCGRCKTYV